MPRDPSTQTALGAITPVILAGGLGRRLWPLSTRVRPKPFLRRGGQSFLKNTAERVAMCAPPFVVCHADHRALAAREVQAAQIILEPEGRGTAPAIAAAAHFIAQRDPGQLMLVLPSDHAIREPGRLIEAVEKGVSAAQDGNLVTFGVRPDHASPHYGYIRTTGEHGDDTGGVDAFIEKPERSRAQEFLRQGGYLWNSGIFLFTAGAYLDQLQICAPLIHDHARQALFAASRLQNAIFLNPQAFSSCPSLSIDYAVMEKAEKRVVVPVSMGWRDLGTWPSLLAALIKR